MKLFLSDGVDVGCVLLLEDDDRVSHLQGPAVHHVRNAEVPLGPVPGVRNSLPEVAGDGVAVAMFLQVVGQPVSNCLLAHHLL